MKNDSLNLPSPARPIMMLRFRIGQESGDVWDRTFRQLEKYPSCCDEVWFSTGLGVAPISTHRQLAAKMGENATQLRKIGILPSLQFQSTIGHSDGINASRDNSGLKWGTYVGKNGEKCRFISCPRQPGFLQYLNEMARLYGAWQPSSVWLDDDLRLNNHWPAMEHGGCHCADCLAAFSKREGRIFTREQLVAECEADIALQKRWIAFGQESLRGIVESIAAGLFEVSPETRFGFQHNRMPDRVPLFPVFQALSGKRCGSRPGAGAYSDHFAYDFMDKAFELAYMKATQPGYDVIDQVCAEIEDCPRVFTSKTPQGLRVETLYYMATGMDSVSYFIMDPLLESPEWYGRELLAPLAAESAMYHDFARHNVGSEPGGLGFYGEFFHVRPLAFPLIGVPIAPYSKLACCKMVHAAVVGQCNDDELKDYLRGNIVLDGHAVEAIQARGFSDLIGGVRAQRTDIRLECLTDDPLADGIDVRYHEAPEAYEILPVETSGGDVRILGRYKTRTGDDRGVASLLLTRPDGTRVAVLGCGGFEATHVSSCRVKFLYRLVDELSGGKMPVLPAEPVQCSIVPRIMADGTLRSVTILNTVMMKQRPVELNLRGVPADVKTVQWLVPSEVPVTLDVHRNGDICTVTLPAIDAWGIGWLKIG